MKRCPTCRRDYYDDSLSFCLDDGIALLNGPVCSSSGQDVQSTIMLPAQPWYRSGSPPHERVNEIDEDLNTIAVLPFANHSQLENSEYFSDGLAEELLSVLSSIRGVRVAGRTSSFAFRGKHLSISEIGRALRVKSVLEGSVRMAGERVRIAVQLVDVRNGYQLWSATYDRMMDDIFAIQDDIAQAVVEELSNRFFGTSEFSGSNAKFADGATIAIKGRSCVPEAHRLMLMGRYLLERLNEDDAAKAVGYFRQALDIDPGYAQCWAKLGRAYDVATNYCWNGLDTAYTKAEVSLRRALELDSDLAEAYAFLGRIRWFRDADFFGTEQCLKRALTLAPDSIDVLLSAVPTARENGQFEMAIKQCKRAVTIDPLSPTAWSTTAVAKFFADDLDGAESAARRAMELAPQRIVLHAFLGLILLNKGRVDEALDEALLEAEKSPWRSWSLTIIYHATGKNAESDRELEKLVADHSAGSAFQIAEACSMRGEVDEAFKWLEHAIDNRDPGRLSAKVSPLLKPIHTDPRWSPLLSRIGFPRAVVIQPHNALQQTNMLKTMAG